MKTRIVLPLCLAFILTSVWARGDQVDLSGRWSFRLDSRDVGVKQQWFNRKLPDRINLPSSLQEQGFGDEVTPWTQWTVNGANHHKWLKDPRYARYRRPGQPTKIPFMLQPAGHYVGPAWYRKHVTIPDTWRGKHIVLSLERCHWETALWVDGRAIGSADSLAVPHQYDLSNVLTPGEHALSVRVDNRVKIKVGLGAHSVSDHTQTNWNGIIGRIRLVARDPVWIDNVQVYPDVAGRRARIVATIANRGGKIAAGRLVARVHRHNTKTGNALTGRQVAFEADSGGATVEFDYPMGDNVQLWDEFNPALYRLELGLEAEGCIDTKTVVFGMRRLTTKGTQFVLNGRPIILRGTLECCIFPLTGYPATDVESWKRIIHVCKQYGLNHVRFHSYCPPEAAFIAADELGFYYQVECGVWGLPGDDPKLDAWLTAESKRILRRYGNHPSFMFLCHGNEPHSRNKRRFLAGLVNQWKQLDPRHLYTAGAHHPLIPENDYHNPGYVEGFSLRLFDSRGLGCARSPGTTDDYREQTGKVNVPAVSHEPGQWCAFPNLKEIGKYTGVLKAKNFEIVEDCLEEKGLLHQAHAFLMASGKLQVLLYKEEIETLLHTPGIGGFQLLGLQDFPGQGTALVGVLDPFWDGKGYVTAERHRRYCGNTVPLARFAKHIWTTDETFSAVVEVSHFGPNDLDSPKPAWCMTNPAGRVIASGRWPDHPIPTGKLSPLGEISVDLKDAPTPTKLTLAVIFEGTHFANDWDIWVYPPKIDTAAPPDVLVVADLDEKTIERLHSGGKVLLMPPARRIKGDTHGAFDPIFWNKAWFPEQKVHTLGILCDPKHPALAAFPTEYHGNYQWRDLNVHSKPIIMDDLPRELFPIVQVIDDWNTCRKLGLVFEAKVGGGKLLVCSIDLQSDLDRRPAARQLHYSLLQYISSELFDPKTVVGVEQVRALLKEIPADGA